MTAIEQDGRGVVIMRRYPWRVQLETPERCEELRALVGDREALIRTCGDVHRTWPRELLAACLLLTSEQVAQLQRDLEIVADELWTGDLIGEIAFADALVPDGCRIAN